MPWRTNRDPYSIWLSEIILQQTQVAQGTPYFEKFLSRFPELRILADATETEVLKLWQGLGYYSRARNLLSAAKYIQNDLGGHFPDTYEKLKQLKGVGDYTAAAIASIAFGEQVAVVDGNVARVLARLFEVENPINTGKGKKIIDGYAKLVLNKNNPAMHNQAMMELGSLICRPVNPKCDACPIFDHCLSAKNGSTLRYPIKIKKKKSQKMYFHFIVPVLHENKTYLTQRTEVGIWKNMYTFPLVITEGEASLEERLLHIEAIGPITEWLGSIHMTHILTHKHIEAQFSVVRLKEVEQIKKKNIFEVEIETFRNHYPLPRIMTKFLESEVGSVLLKE